MSLGPLMQRAGGGGRADAPRPRTTQPQPPLPPRRLPQPRPTRRFFPWAPGGICKVRSGVLPQGVVLGALGPRPVGERRGAPASPTRPAVERPLLSSSALQGQEELSGTGLSPGACQPRAPCLGRTRDWQASGSVGTAGLGGRLPGASEGAPGSFSSLTSPVLPSFQPGGRPAGADQAETRGSVAAPAPPREPCGPRPHAWWTQWTPASREGFWPAGCQDSSVWGE